MPDKHRVILWVKRNVLYVCPPVCIGNHSRSVDWHVIAPQILALGNSEQKSFVKYVHIAISGDGGIRTPVQNNPYPFVSSAFSSGSSGLSVDALSSPGFVSLTFSIFLLDSSSSGIFMVK